MTCKSRDCECNDHRRSEHDAQLLAEASKCRNQFCKQGDACPSRTCWAERSREEVEAGLIAMNKHITEAVQQHKPIDMCYDNARRKILRAMAELPLPMSRIEQNRLLHRDQLLAEIEAEVRPALAVHRDPKHAGKHLLDWFRSSSILRGQRI